MTNNKIILNKQPPLVMFPFIILSCLAGALWTWFKLSFGTFIRIPYVVYKILEGFYNNKG